MGHLVSADLTLTSRDWSRVQKFQEEGLVCVDIWGIRRAVVGVNLELPGYLSEKLKDGGGLLEELSKKNKGNQIIPGKLKS